MRSSVQPLADDLRRVFGDRLFSLVAYGDPDDPNGVRTLALVESLAFTDLAACARLVGTWHKAGLEAPLLLTRDEFARTLDVFPLEYGSIIDRHVVVAGASPFAGMQVKEADLRRACEMQTKSHLIHLREGFIESGGAPATVAAMMTASSAALRALVGNLERLDTGITGRAGVTPELVREVTAAGSSTIADPSALFSRYVAAIERLWEEVDRA